MPQGSKNDELSAQDIRARDVYAGARCAPKLAVPSRPNKAAKCTHFLALSFWSCQQMCMRGSVLLAVSPKTCPIAVSFGAGAVLTGAMGALRVGPVSTARASKRIRPLCPQKPA
mgnify:CR=1 FL=1